jgi:large subunit ribosomal protein L1
MAKKQTTEGDKKPTDAAAPAEAKPEPKPETKEGKPEKKPRAPKPTPEGAEASKPGASAAPAAPAPAAPSASAAPSDSKKRKKPGVPPSRGKKLRNHLKNLTQKLAKEGPSPLKKAVSLLKQSKRAKFDETVEIHMSLGVDTTQSDQLIRGTVPLPHGVGKTVRVVVFCQGDNVPKAKEAGADFAGSDDLIEKIQK